MKIHSVQLQCLVIIVAGSFHAFFTVFSVLVIHDWTEGCVSVHMYVYV